MKPEGFFLCLLLISIFANLVQLIWVCRSKKKKVSFSPTLPTARANPLPRRGPDVGFERFADAWSADPPPSTFWSARPRSQHTTSTRVSRRDSTASSAMMSEVSGAAAAASLSAASNDPYKKCEIRRSGAAVLNLPRDDVYSQYANTGAVPRYENVPLNELGKKSDAEKGAKKEDSASLQPAASQSSLR